MTWEFIQTAYPDIEDDMIQHSKGEYHIQCAEDGSYVLWHDKIVGYTSEDSYQYEYTMVKEFNDLEKAMDHVENIYRNND
jgi:hypothetical protein